MKVTEIIELKDGEAFLAAATGGGLAAEDGGKAAAAAAVTVPVTTAAASREVAVKLKKVDEDGNILVSNWQL